MPVVGRGRWQKVSASVIVLIVAAVVLNGALGGDQGLETQTNPRSTPGGPYETDSTSSTSPAQETVPTLAPPDGAERATLTRVIDGDTVEVDILGAGTEKVRLVGINTPESGECFSEEATAALTHLLSEGVFTMTADRTDEDQYGRLLRYLWLDRGVFVNEILVRGGFALARDYAPDSQFAPEFEAAQSEAQAAGEGLWAPDACGPESGAVLDVIEVSADAPGQDNQNLNGEWVDVVNAGLAPESLAGWVLKDESASHRYTFPDGFTLDPQSVVRVFTGCGINTQDRLYWCNNSAVWNNTGDTAFVLDPLGNIAAQYDY